jgi:predicted ATPase
VTALVSVDDALASAEQTGERWFEAEAQRIKGEILVKREAVNKAALGSRDVHARSGVP